MNNNKNESRDLMSRLYLSNDAARAAYEKLSQKRLSEKVLQTTEVDRGIILPCRGSAGGVCTEQFEFISGHATSFYNKPNSLPQNFYKSYKVSREEITFIDETVVFGGIMQDHPGHQVMEGIANRMWWHLKNPDSKLRFAFIRIWGDGSGRFVKEFLDLLGIPDERIIFITAPTQFAKIIIPEQCMCYLDFFTNEYKLVIDKLKQNIKPAVDEKIYLTKNAKGDTLNEDYFIEFFRNKGFKIINPEDFTMKEKIAFMRGAKEVACIGGTNALYTIFSEPDVTLYLLGRANDPVSEQYIPYEAANIHNMYVVDVCLSFFHRNRVWGVNLLGPTDYWRKFVTDVFHETIDLTKDEVIKQFCYDYMKKCAEYYSDPFMFDSFKRFSHFSIIQLMNKMLCDKELDVTKYNTLAPQTDISVVLITNVLNFTYRLCLDIYGGQRFNRFLKSLSKKKVVILKRHDKAGDIFNAAAEVCGADIILSSGKGTLPELSDAELSVCKKADVIVSCCVHGTKTHERDGVKCINIWDILREESLTADLPKIYEGTDNVEISGYIAELREEILKLSELFRLSKNSEETFKGEIKTLHAEKDKLQKDLDRLFSDNRSLTECIAKITEEKTNLLENSSSVSRLTEKNKTLEVQNEQLTASIGDLSVKLSAAEERVKALEYEQDELGRALNRSSTETNQAQEALNAANQEIERLKDKLYQMENSRSWRYTRIFRKKPKDE